MGNFSNYWDLTTLFTKLKNKLKSISDKIDDSVSLKTATGNPITLTDAANANAEELSMTIEPVQDLHGYSKPWPAGGGKNLLPLTVDTMKAVNTSGTWTGNEYSLNGVTFTIQTDSDENVTGIVLNGTASLLTTFTIVGNTLAYLSAGSYILNGLSSDRLLVIRIHESAGNKWYFGPFTYNGSDDGDCYLQVLKGQTISNVTVNPMIRISTETDATFAPYTNICPISGLTSGEVTRVGKNLLGVTLSEFKTANTVGTWSGDVYTYGGVSVNIDIDSKGYITGFNITGTAASELWFYVKSFNINGSYKICGNQTSTRTRISLFKNGTPQANLDNDDAPYTFTASAADTYQIIFKVLSGTYNDDKVQPMYMLATETDLTFEPYTAATATITLGQTVYGGSVNFKTGEVTVTHGYGKIKDFTWLNGSANKFYCAPSNCKNDPVIISSVYPYCGSQAVSGNPSTDKAIGHWGAQLVVMDTSYNNATNFVTAMGEEEVCYELATPTTLTLTPAELELLKGNNTITANGAEISIEYYPDNAIGALAGRVDNVQEQVTTKASTADVTAALAKKADITTVTIPAFTPPQAGWRRICKVKPASRSTANGMIYIGGDWASGQPASASVAISTMHNAASLTLLSSTIRDEVRITDMRLVSPGFVTEFWLDIYYPVYSNSTGPFKLTFTGDIAVSDIQDPISITTDSRTATAEISLDQKVSGTVLTDESEVETISGTGSYGCTYTAYKYGRVVQLSIRGVTNETTGQSMQICTLPEGWRPIIKTGAVGTYFSGSLDAATLAVIFRIHTDGSVQTYSYRVFNNGSVDIIYIL